MEYDNPSFILAVHKHIMPIYGEIAENPDKLLIYASRTKLFIICLFFIKQMKLIKVILKSLDV